MQASSPSPLLHTLNPVQPAYARQARRRVSPVKRLLVLAGAGAGKSKTMIQKILYLA